jgi:crossover junction endodeoxyribonuclease RuvC
MSLEIAGIDLSMTSTGVTRLCWEDDGTLWPFQRRVTSTGKDSDTTAQRRTRLRWIADEVANEVADAHLVVIEGLAFAAAGKHAAAGVGLWWLTFDGLLADKPHRPIAIVTPSQRMTYAVGKGGGPTAAKDRVLAAVLRRYPQHFDVDGNDLADSTLLAAMGARNLGRPVEESLPLTHIAAMTKVNWPEGVLTR